MAPRRRLVVLAVVLALITGCRPDTPTTEGVGSRGGEELIVEFHGASDQLTSEFEVEREWEVRWTTEATTFEVTLLSSGDEQQLVRHEGGGGGSTYPVVTGTFQLDVTSDGPWSIRVLEVPD